MRLFSLLLALCFIGAVQAQDIFLTQGFAIPQVVNPAFAGSGVTPRAAIGFQQQAFTSNAPVGLLFSYDQEVPVLKGGIGAMVTNLSQNGGDLSGTNVAINYAYRRRLLETVNIAAAIQLGVVNQTVNLGNDLTESASEFDLGFGVLLHSKKAHLGASLLHLTDPELNLPSGAAAGFDNLLTIHGGYQLKLPSADWGLEGNVRYTSQNDFNEIYAGLLFQRQFYSFGGAYSTEEVISGMFGVDVGKFFRVGYSFNYQLGNFVGNVNRESHEAMITMLLSRKDTKRGRLQSFFN